MKSQEHNQKVANRSVTVVSPQGIAGKDGGEGTRQGGKASTGVLKSAGHQVSIWGLIPLEASEESRRRTSELPN